MKKVGMLIALFTMVFLGSMDAQRTANRSTDQGPRTEKYASNTKQHKKGKHCKAINKRHNKKMRKMRRMANADGRVTPREKQMLRREKRSI